MNKKKTKIFIAGHKGMVGSAILKKLKENDFKKIITVDKKKLNFINQTKTLKFINKIKPDIVIIAAAKVGGITFNNLNRAQFIYENTMIHSNIIHSSYLNNVKKIIFLGSSCMYPKDCKQPMKEEYLLNGKFEPTNEPYALAKMHGIKMCESYNYQYKTNYLSLIPASMYGPNDNYNNRESHVIPALMKKLYLAKKNKAKKVEIWGSGKPKREFLHVYDFADFIVELIQKKIKPEILNIGSGTEITIKKLALILKNITQYKGKLIFNKSKPDGVYRKLLDSKKVRSLGFKKKINFEQALMKIYNEKFH
mgnify:FL=1